MKSERRCKTEPLLTKLGSSPKYYLTVLNLKQKSFHFVGKAVSDSCFLFISKYNYKFYGDYKIYNCRVFAKTVKIHVFSTMKLSNRLLLFCCILYE